MQPRKLILTNRQSPGDIVVLTAAVRDLHRQHPGKFRTAVRTTAMELWEHNPAVEGHGAVEGRGAKDEGGEWEEVECHYPLIHKSNEGAWHFIHGFHHFLSERLGVRIEPEAFKGDIHLSREDLEMPSPVAALVKVWAGAADGGVSHALTSAATNEWEVPYWIVVSGGKQDFTAKWWDPARMQAVVDHFAGRILFVQVGEAGHHHPALRGVVDLRGKTSLRELVRLVHHAAGVVCPVTLAMHLAAAVPVRDARYGMRVARCAMRNGGAGGLPSTFVPRPSTPPGLRPCVVIAGGREPAHWEAYPGHQFIHTIGALDCCATGGCWKSRVVPLGDGDGNDRSLCQKVMRVDATTGRAMPGPPVDGAKFAKLPGTHPLPRCMEMITAEEVIRRVQWYLDGGQAWELTAEEAVVCEGVWGGSEGGAAVPAVGPMSVPPDDLRWSVGGFGLKGRRDACWAHRQDVCVPPVPACRDATFPTAAVTICVLTHGDYPELTKRCIESIRRHCRGENYRLFVGSNAVGARTRAYLRRLRVEGAIHHWEDDRESLHKRPMMARLFEQVRTEFVWWFDDDSQMTSDGTLRRWMTNARESAAASSLLKNQSAQKAGSQEDEKSGILLGHHCS